jgi:hypothetical protein
MNSDRLENDKNKIRMIRILTLKVQNLMRTNHHAPKHRFSKRSIISEKNNSKKPKCLSRFVSDESTRLQVCAFSPKNAKNYCSRFN